MSSAAHDRRRHLVHDLLARRREQLGLDQIDLPPTGLDLPPRERQDYELALSLPPGSLAAIRDVSGPFPDPDPDQILADLDAGNPLPTETVPTCGACALPVARLIGRLELPFRIVAAPDRRCLCRKSSCTELDYLFRIALEVAGRPRLLVIGGNPDSDKALRRIDKPEVHVVRERIRRVDPRLVGAVDVMLIARGIAKHKDTLPYTEAYDALPDHRRPLRLETQSPNANAQALTLIAERARIRAHLARGEATGGKGSAARR
jgi:hypothetical protein